MRSAALVISEGKLGDPMTLIVQVDEKLKSKMFFFFVFAWAFVVGSVHVHTGAVAIVTESGS